MVVVDRFHLVQLANQALTEYRRELTWATRGRRGRKVDPEWAQRNRLLRAGETLTAEETAKMHDAMRTADPSGGLEKLLAGKGTAPQPARSGPRRRTGPQPDLAAPDRLLHALRGLRDRPTPAPGMDRERLAALHHRRPDHRHQQRPHRGLQQNRQTHRKDRLRLQEHRKPETPDTLRLHPRITPGANQNPEALLTPKSLHTPADVHYGLAGDTARQRSQTLEAARQQHPTRFATTHDPKILELPESAWINEPRKEDPAA